MKKLLLSLLLVTQLLQSSFAQNWTYYKDFPVNVSPIDIVSNNAGTLFMMTSDFRLFYKTINGVWTEFETGQGTGPISPQCISVNKSSNRFYVGDQFSGGIFYTLDFGATWQQNYLTTNPVTGFHEPIIELSNVTNPNLFFGGSFDGFTPLIVKYTNQGQNGQIIAFDPNNITGNIPNELIYTANQKLLIGTETGGIWIGQNNGTTFTQSNYNQNQVYRFAEDNNGRVYALVYDEANDDILLIYSDDYINWMPMNLPNDTDRYTTIHFDTFSNNLWLGSETGIYKLLITSTSTTAWANGSFNNGEQFLVKILGDNNGSIYNFSNQTIAQKLNTAGNNWVNTNNGLTGTATKVIFGTNDRLFASSYSINNVSTALNQTANWENINLGGQTTGINNLYSRPNGKIFADTGLKIKKSLDNGATYTDITPPNIPNFILRFYVGEAGNLFMVKSNETDKLYWSQNEGLTWSLLHTFPSFLSFFPDSIRTIAEDSNGVIYLTLSTLETSSDIYKVYYSTNQGATWNVKTITQTELSGSDTEVFAKQDKVFFQYGGQLYKFVYNASNDLTPINPPAGFNYLNFVWVDNLGNYYIFNDDLYKSTNEGATWTNLGKPNQVNTPAVDDILFDSNNRAYIVTKNTLLPSDRGIYYVTETLGVENPSTENPIAIYPNPAQNIINIQTQENIIEAAVYDVLGKKVTVNQLSGNSLDVSNLAQGLYIIKITGESNKTFSSKFIKN